MRTQGGLISIHKLSNHLANKSFPYPGDLPEPGFKPTSPTAPTLYADSFLLSTREALNHIT